MVYILYSLGIDLPADDAITASGESESNSDNCTESSSDSDELELSTNMPVENYQMVSLFHVICNKFQFSFHQKIYTVHLLLKNATPESRVVIRTNTIEDFAKLLLQYGHLKDISRSILMCHVKHGDISQRLNAQPPGLIKCLWFTKPATIEEPLIHHYDEITVFLPSDDLYFPAIYSIAKLENILSCHHLILQFANDGPIQDRQAVFSISDYVLKLRQVRVLTVVNLRFLSYDLFVALRKIATEECLCSVQIFLNPGFTLSLSNHLLKRWIQDLWPQCFVQFIVSDSLANFRQTLPSSDLYVTASILKADASMFAKLSGDIRRELCHFLFQLPFVFYKVIEPPIVLFL